MKELLQRSDLVMVLVNLSPQTHKLIGAKQFAMMKPNSTFINISRGLVVDQDALVDALKKKIIRAAALDVMFPEPLPCYTILNPSLQVHKSYSMNHKSTGTHTVETSQITVEWMTNALAAVTEGQLPDEVKA